MKGEFYKMEFDAWDEGTVDLTLEEEAPSPATQLSPPAETPLFGDLGQDQLPLPRARGTALVPAGDRAIDTAAPGFEAWWSAYPLKKAKGGAKKRYAAIVQAGQATEAQLLDGALRYAAEKAGTDPKYTKHPTTWLNNSCWLDEPDKPPDANGFGMLSSTSQRFLQNSAYLKDQQCRRLQSSEGSRLRHQVVEPCLCRRDRPERCRERSL